MEAIKETIKGVIAALDSKKGIAPEEQIESFLKKILTKREFGHIKVNYFRKGILGIGVESSSWLYHLNLKKRDLLIQLQRGISTIKDIHFFIGEIK